VDRTRPIMCMHAAVFHCTGSLAAHTGSRAGSATISGAPPGLRESEAAATCVFCKERGGGEVGLAEGALVSRVFIRSSKTSDNDLALPLESSCTACI
jgi:hypothetical protein